MIVSCDYITDVIAIADDPNKGLQAFAVFPNLENHGFRLGQTVRIEVKVTTTESVRWCSRCRNEATYKIDGEILVCEEHADAVWVERGYDRGDFWLATAIRGQHILCHPEAYPEVQLANWKRLGLEQVYGWENQQARLYELDQEWPYPLRDYHEAVVPASGFNPCKVGA